MLKAVTFMLAYTIVLGILFAYVIPCDDGFWRGFRLFYRVECR